MNEGGEALLHPALTVGFPRSPHQAGVRSVPRLPGVSWPRAVNIKYNNLEPSLRKTVELKNHRVPNDTAALSSVRLSSPHFCVCLNYLSVGDFITRVNQTDSDR